MAIRETLDLLHPLVQKSLETWLESGDSIVFRFECRDEVLRILGQAGIPYDRIEADKISIGLTDYPGLFYDKEHFLSQSIDTFIFDADIGILKFDDASYLYFNCREGRTYRGPHLDESNRLVQNTRDYWKFYAYFNTSDISEYNSSTDRRFILVSPEKGRFYLGYPAIPPEFPNDMDLSRKYARLEQISPAHEFRLFFEMQIIEFLSSYREEERFRKLIEHIETIIHTSENNYKLYLNKFSFDKLRNEFRQARDRYFASIRTIVDQLLSRVVSIPISISAAALALYNLKAEPGYSAVVAIAFVVYSLFTAFLLRLLHGNVFEIRQDLDDDIRRIKSESGIDPSDVDRETTKVYAKIRLLHRTIIMLQLLLVGLSLAVLSVYFQFLILPVSYAVLWLFLVLGLQLLLSFASLNKKAASANP